jgi:hypothetical protein
VTHSIEKAQSHELGEYLYVVGDGFAIGEEDAAKRTATDAPIELILVYPEEMLSRLKFVGEEGRENFIPHVGELLDEMRAQDENRRAWEEIAGRFEA